MIIQAVRLEIKKLQFNIIFCYFKHSVFKFAKHTSQISFKDIYP
jgi:hypothetical protein